MIRIAKAAAVAMLALTTALLLPTAAHATVPHATAPRADVTTSATSTTSATRTIVSPDDMIWGT